MMTRDEINALRAEDNLGPIEDDTIRRLFGDFKAIFGQGQKLPMFDKEETK